MTQYLLSVYETAETRNTPREDMSQIYKDVDAVIHEIMDAGIFVFAGGLEARDTAAVVDPRSGMPVVTDGPYLETKEFLGGFTVIDVPDRDTALEWAKKMAVACRLPQEVRAFESEPSEGE